MTVIAWDGKTLAADKQATCNGLKRTVTKIHRVGDALLGFSGNYDLGSEMLRWFIAGADPEKFPAAQRVEGHVDILLVNKDGAIFKYERSPVPIPFEDRYFAMGCGRDFAAAALELGFDARRAVEVACTLSDGCGMGIDTLTLEDAS